MTSDGRGWIHSLSQQLLAVLLVFLLHLIDLLADAIDFDGSVVNRFQGFIRRRSRLVSRDLRLVRSLFSGGGASLSLFSLLDLLLNFRLRRTASGRTERQRRH